MTIILFLFSYSVSLLVFVLFCISFYLFWINILITFRASNLPVLNLLKLVACYMATTTNYTQWSPITRGKHWSIRIRILYNQSFSRFSSLWKIASPWPEMTRVRSGIPRICDHELGLNPPIQSHNLPLSSNEFVAIPLIKARSQERAILLLL